MSRWRSCAETVRPWSYLANRDRTLGVDAFKAVLALLASGIGLASMGAAGIWLLDASGVWLIVSIAVLALGTVLVGFMLMQSLILAIVAAILGAVVAILGAGAAVVIIPIGVCWELIKTIIRWGRKLCRIGGSRSRGDEAQTRVFGCRPDEQARPLASPPGGRRNGERSEDR